MSNIFNQIYQEALKQAPSTQTWPGHFLAKKTETEILLGCLDIDKINKKSGLEIGCGNGFQSALIATIADRLVATDLFDENNRSHTVGMSKTKNLLDSLNSKNIKLVSCSGTSLPFPDNSFDFLFSSSALEHFDDKELALREMRRVLKYGGTAIVIVPTHMPSLYAFIHVYLYIIARFWKIIFKKDCNPIEASLKTGKDGGQNSLFKKFRKNHPSFPIPEPHGAYKNVFEETYSQLPFSWIKLIKKNGFSVKDSIGICLLPWLLIEPFSTMAAAKLYSLSKSINIKLSSAKALQYVSYLMCIILSKSSNN